MRIFVTNDDGIDSVGLHHLAAAVRPFGEVVIVAPDSEYSGASAAVGALNLMRPDVHRVDSPVDGVEAWSISGPPALCILFSRLGVFGAPPDLVVSGINPGANVGRSVYHSGTIGAALTARTGRISGIAFSQEVDMGSVDGQAAWEEVVLRQKWETAARVAAEVVGGFVASPPRDAVVLNINVPNLDFDEIKGWRTTKVAALPMRTMSSARLEPKPGHANAFRIEMAYGDPLDLPIETDGGAVNAGFVSVCQLTRLEEEPLAAELDKGLRASLDGAFGINA